MGLASLSSCGNGKLTYSAAGGVDCSITIDFVYHKLFQLGQLDCPRLSENIEGWIYCGKPGTTSLLTRLQISM